MTHGFVAKKKGLADLESFGLMKYVLVSPEFVYLKDVPVTPRHQRTHGDITNILLREFLQQQ